MARKIFLINLLLVAGIAVAAQQLISRWRSYEQTHTVSQVVGKLGGKPAQPMTLDLGPEGRESLPGDYMTIAQHNLFSPDRRPEEEEGGDEESQAPEFPKKPQMNGVTTLGGQLKAMLTVFPSEKGPGESRMVGIGDSVQGYVVSAITDTTLTLQWNDQSVVIDLFDSQLIPQQASQKRVARSVNIITIGSERLAKLRKSRRIGFS